MKIAEMKIHTFWKGETGVDAEVEEGESRYEVRLLVKNGSLSGFSCSCKSGGSQREGCAHVSLVWEAWKNRQRTAEARPVSTSQEIRAMIREYTNREVARIIQESEEAEVRLVPRLLLKGGKTFLEFKVGRERLYVVKDLNRFVQALEMGTQVEYGRQLSFHHSIRAFVPQDRPLCAFLMELVKGYEEYREQFKRGAYVTVGELRSLNVSRANRDRFFSIMKGRTIETEIGQEGICQVTVAQAGLLLPVRMSRTGRDGIRLSVDPEFYGFPGESCWYVGNRERLLALDEAESARMGVFLEQMLKDRRSHTLVIQERDMPLFYERVLKKILPCIRLSLEGLELEQYQPQELRAVFEFDSAGPEELSLRPELSYGDFSFQPVEDDTVPRTVCRDVPGEFRISQVITRYFKYREDGSGTLLIRNDEDALFRLLNDGIPEFMELGEVRLTDRARRLQVLAPPRVEASVRTESGWLELRVEAEGMTQAQMQSILSEYDPKKPYYRLKSGEFLRLDNNGLITVAKLARLLETPGGKSRGGVWRLPLYRALYLDGALKEGSGITFYRDQLFKAMVRGMKSVEDSEFPVPDSLRQVLRGYQKTGFRWMKTLDQWGFGGILADDMGLGKTVQTIALLLDGVLAEPQSRSLIVCPAALVYNWERELHRFAPQLPVRVVAGNGGEREEILKDPHPGEVLVTSYDLLKRDIGQYQDMEFRFQILDEAQAVKNPGTQSARAVRRIHSRTRFALTGTPIENRLGELWSMFDYLMPGFLFTSAVFKKRFELPIVKERDGEALERLRKLTSPFILRRLKQDVLKELPPKEETIVYSRAEKEQRELYQAYARKLREELDGTGGGLGRDSLQILAQLTRLRQICCDPALCFHGYRGGAAKLDTCLELVKNGIEGGHKILLFSQFSSMLERIGERLKKEKIECYLLTGSTPKEERIRMAGAFQTDAVPVFLISLKAGGTGLNLTAADLVIHYDPWWNMAAQNQATDRAHRMGQEKQVSVFKLILQDTIEESIMKLQEKKRDLADQIITGEGSLEGGLSREELLRILS